MDYDLNMELIKRENSTMRDSILSFRKMSFKESSVPTTQGDTVEEVEKTHEEIKAKGRDVTDLMHDFGSRTTAHGWGRVANAQARVVKLVWITITLLALTATSVQVGLLTHSYLQFSTETKWQLGMYEVEFPSVTLCNIQPYSISTAQTLMKNSSSKFYQWYNVTSNLEYFRGLAALLNKSKEFEWVENRMKQPVGYFENIGNEAMTVGHQGLDFMIRCGFGLTNCNATNFTFYQSPTYYNCFTFNGGNVSQEKLVSKTSGPQEGLSLILYLENDNGEENLESDYHTLSTIGNAGGVRITVHAPNTRPSPVDQGIDIPQGYSANVGLDVFRYIRLGEPSGNCMESHEFTTDRYVYSTHACLALCQQLYVVAQCNCLSSSLPTPDSNIFNITYCGNWNVTSAADFMSYFQTLECEADALWNFTTNEAIKAQCKCYPTCNEFAYQTDLSYSYWPLDFTQEDFYKTLILDSPIKSSLKAYNNLKNFTTTELIQRNMIRQNFARVNVFLKAMTIQEYIEKRSYEPAKFFSDIGGSFGLWIGMSAITWCEVVELIVHIIFHGGKRLLWNRDQKKQGNPDDKEKY